MDFYSKQRKLFKIIFWKFSFSLKLSAAKKVLKLITNFLDEFWCGDVQSFQLYNRFKSVMYFQCRLFLHGSVCNRFLSCTSISKDWSWTCKSITFYPTIVYTMKNVQLLLRSVCVVLRNTIFWNVIFSSQIWSRSIFSR